MILPRTGLSEPPTRFFLTSQPTAAPIFSKAPYPTVSKQNALAFPKLHVGSSQTFGDTLALALGEGADAPAEQSAGSNQNRAGNFTAGDRTGSQQPQSRPPFAIAQDALELTPAANHVADITPEAVGPPMVKASAQEAGRTAAPNPRNEPKLQTETQLKHSAQGLAGESAPITCNIFAPSARPEALSQQTPTASAGKSVSDQVQIGSMSRTASNRAPAQDGGLKAQDLPPRLTGEVEAFRLSLHLAASTPLPSTSEIPRAPWPTGGAIMSGSPPQAANADTEKAALAMSAPEVGSQPQRDTGKEATEAPRSSPELRACVSANSVSLKDRENSAGPEPAKPSEIPQAPNFGSGDIAKQVAGPAPAVAFAPVVPAPKGQASPPAQPVYMTDGIEASGAKTTREMMVRVEATSGEVISVRLVDQGGHVQVAVRSSDPSTASLLRQDLPSLASTLDRIGWKTDIAGAASQQAFTHDPARSDNGSQQSSQNGFSLAWNQESARRKPSMAELWDQALDHQDTSRNTFENHSFEV